MVWFGGLVGICFFVDNEIIFGVVVIKLENVFNINIIIIYNYKFIVKMCWKENEVMVWNYFYVWESI